MEGSFGEKLRSLREKRGLTLNQLAIYSEVSPALISKIENNKRGIPKPKTLEKLAKGLKMNYVELMNIAGYSEEEELPDKNNEKDAVDKLIEYLELELTDDEIMERMTFKVDNLTLSEDEVREFIAFVRAKRFMKSGLPGASRFPEP